MAPLQPRPQSNFLKKFRLTLIAKRCAGDEVGPFNGWGPTDSRLEQPLRGGSLLFTTKFEEIPGTHFIDFGKMKG